MIICFIPVLPARTEAELISSGVSIRGPGRKLSPKFFFQINNGKILDLYTLKFTL